MAQDREGGSARPAPRFGGDTPLGRRRTEIADAPEPVEIPAEALVEREVVTVLCSEKGWIRAVQGPHTARPREKQNTRTATAPRFVGHCRDHRPPDRVRQQCRF